jgi:hypothetical protein
MSYLNPLPVEIYDASHTIQPGSDAGQWVVSLAGVPNPAYPSFDVELIDHPNGQHPVSGWVTTVSGEVKWNDIVSGSTTSSYVTPSTSTDKVIKASQTPTNVATSATATLNFASDSTRPTVYP